MSPCMFLEKQRMSMMRVCELTPAGGRQCAEWSSNRNGSQSTAGHQHVETARVRTPLCRQSTSQVREALHDFIIIENYPLHIQQRYSKNSTKHPLAPPLPLLQYPRPNYTRNQNVSVFHAFIFFILSYKSVYLYLLLCRWLNWLFSSTRDDRIIPISRWFFK